MSIYATNITTYQQNFECKTINKETYGEVHTDFSLVERILDLLPEELYKDPTKKWLDPCAGRGYFGMILYKRLFNSLQTKIKAPKKRHRHIIENMIYMIELNPEHLSTLYTTFGENANISNHNFLELSKLNFDVIIGNPPFNANGAKKVPTNNRLSKKKDGISVWSDFVTHAVKNLTNKGWLAMITPSIWLKRDHSYHNYLCDRGEIYRLNCMTNTETNQIFHKQAQTPTTFFSFIKDSSRKGKIKVYDSVSRTYLSCDSLSSIPLISPKIVKKVHEYVKKVGCIDVIKTSMRPGYKGLSVVSVQDEKHPYKNISTCILNHTKPQLVLNFSNKLCSYAKTTPKLVLGHKMYGFPYLDMEGYGISNRDNYVIKDYPLKELKMIKDFLTTKLAFVIFESTRYRMKYLERYAFEFIPNITKLKDFPSNITDKTVAEFFNFNEMERKYIENITKKKYLQFI